MHRLMVTCRESSKNLQLQERNRRTSYLNAWSEGVLHACYAWWDFKIPYLRGDPMSNAGGVGLLPALCRRRTAWRLNVLRSRRNATVSSQACAAASRQTQVKSEPRPQTGTAAEPASPLTSHPQRQRELV